MSVMVAVGRLSFMDPSRHMTVDHTDLTDEADWPVVVQVEVGMMPLGTMDGLLICDSTLLVSMPG